MLGIRSLGRTSSGASEHRYVDDFSECSMSVGMDGSLSNQYQKFSVVPYTSKRLQQIMVAVVIVGYLLVAFAGYWGGVNHSRMHLDMNASEIQLLEKRKAELEERVSNNKATLVKQTQELILERQTIELLRQENVELQENIGFLEKELALFQRVVKTNNEAKGLVLGRLDIKEGGDGTFELSLDVIQISGRGRVKGKLYLEIEGFDVAQDGAEKSLLLHQFSDAQTGTAVALNFTNYQTVTVKAKLPPDFDPQQIRVKAQFSRGKKVDIQERYDWAVKG